MATDGAGPDGSELSDGLGRDAKELKPTRAFCVKPTDQTHNTEIEVVEYSDGTIQFAMITRRAEMDPLVTVFRVSAKTFRLLSDAMNAAAHEPGIWFPA